MSCRCPPAGSPTYLLLLEASSCPVDLRGFSPGQPPSQCQAETGWGAASMTQHGIVEHKKGPVPPSVTCSRPCWGQYVAIFLNTGHRSLGSSLSTLQSCILLLFPKHGVFAFRKLWDFLAQDTTREKWSQYSCRKTLN